jgi:hypothetical protein
MIYTVDIGAILSTGVLTQGLAALVWAVRLEMRVRRLEATA